MLASLLTWYLPSYPRLPVNPQDSTSYLPTRRYYKELPAFIDKLCYSIDQPFLSLIQSHTSPYIVFCAQLFSMLFSTNTLACFPTFFLLLGKYDLVFICVAIIGTYLCLTWLMKRFVWRYRPYMVNRGKLVIPVPGSSFPNLLCSNVIIFLFLTVLILDWTFHLKFETYDPYPIQINQNSFIFSPFFIIPGLLTLVLSAYFSIYCSLSYPTDCVAGIANGLFFILLGTLAHKGCLLFCSVDIYVIDSIDLLSLADFILIICIFIFGSTIVCMSMSYPILLPCRVSVLMGIYFPAIVFTFLYICSDRIYLVERNFGDNDAHANGNTVSENILYGLLSVVFLHLLVKLPNLKESDGLGKKMFHFITSFWGCFFLISLLRLSSLSLT